LHPAGARPPTAILVGEAIDEFLSTADNILRREYKELIGGLSRVATHKSKSGSSKGRHQIRGSTQLQWNLA
jgi:hypothetical protein